MIIHDISQEVFGCKVFPGDPKPQKQTLSSVDKGDMYNLTAISMCTHNGTHIDAPYHFINNGKTVDQLGLDHFVGDCYVARHDGFVDEKVACDIMAEAVKNNASKRILIGGKAVVTSDGAKVFAENKILLLGNESQTIGPEDAPMEVHKILLEKEIVLLEGIDLENIKIGTYILNCVPLNLSDSDGAPCRAILIEKDITNP